MTSFRIETRSGAEGPVVAKIASDAPGRARLGREAERLEQARHPGVVELLHADADELVLRWAGDRTFELVQPPLDEAAALLAAVASTVADLHELGIVHGRIRPEHVVVGADGRPRLCSLGGGDDGAGPADDVAGIGHLIDRLVGGGLEPEPIPDRRWARRRAGGADRRSLMAVADRATQEDAAQRPTARSLALLIIDAVPDARLCRPASVSPPLPAPPPAAGGAVVDEPDTGVDEPDTASEDPGPPPAAVADQPHELPGWVVDHALPPAGRDPWGPRTDDTDIATGTGTGTDADTGDREPVRDRPRERYQPASTTDGPNRVGIVTLVAVAVAVVLVVGFSVVGGRSRPDGPATRGVPAPPPASRVATVKAPGGRCRPVPGTAIDVDGDRCADPYRIEGTTIRVGDRTWAVGQPGDQVSLGDWDCDGSATPGVVRPATGEVFLFPRWPEEGEGLTVRPTPMREGAVGFVAPPSDGTCRSPSIRLRDGSRQAVPAGAVPR